MRDLTPCGYPDCLACKSRVIGQSQLELWVNKVLPALRDDREEVLRQSHCEVHEEVYDQGAEEGEAEG